jgi:hypothetical protein
LYTKYVNQVKLEIKITSLIELNIHSSHKNLKRRGGGSKPLASEDARFFEKLL